MVDSIGEGRCQTKGAPKVAGAEPPSEWLRLGCLPIGYDNVKSSIPILVGLVRKLALESSIEESKLDGMSDDVNGEMGPESANGEKWRPEWLYGRGPAAIGLSFELGMFEDPFATESDAAGEPIGLRTFPFGELILFE